MSTQRRQLALTVVWIVGALLFAFGRPALFGAGASTASSTLADVPVGITPATAASAASGSGKASTDRLIHTLQQKAVASGDAPSYVALAQAYMQKARESGDITYYGLADQAVQHSLSLSPGNFEAVTTAAWIKLVRHDFQSAVALSHQSLKVNAYHSETYGILGDAQVELGDYAGASASYQRMVDLKPGLPSYQRASHFHWLYGDAPGAVKIMRMAVAAGSTFPENVAWCQAQIGDDDWMLGSPLAAEQQYKAALHTFPNDIYGLAGLARLYAGEGHYRQAVAYYKRVIAQVPLPQYVIALGDVYAVMGQAAQAKTQYALVDFIFHLYDVNHINIGIDRAQFYADHNRNLREALRLARQEVTWRHDIRTMDILAWVLYRNHDYRAALSAERQALHLGTRDASFYYHAGMIYAALGDLASARAYLQGALFLNPYFDARQQPVALAELHHLESLPPTKQAPQAVTRPDAGGSHVIVTVPPRS